MRLGYICMSGGRRSLALAAYTNQLNREEFGLDLEAVAIAVSGQRRERHLAKRERRLRKSSKAWFCGNRQLVEKLETEGGDIHPRLGIILLGQGIPEIASLHSQAATPEVIRDLNLGLAINARIRDAARTLCPEQKDTYALGEFLGLKESQWDIPEQHYLFGVEWWRYLKDLKLCARLKGYARNVLEKLAKERSIWVKH